MAHSDTYDFSLFHSQLNNLNQFWEQPFSPGELNSDTKVPPPSPSDALFVSPTCQPIHLVYAERQFKWQP